MRYPIVIHDDGTLTTVYADDVGGLASDLGGEVADVARLTTVEWERDGERSGWAVRAASAPDYALREGSEDPAEVGPVRLFARREDALAAEIRAAVPFMVRAAADKGL